MSDRIPREYPIPKELEKVLDDGLKPSHYESTTSQRYIKILKALKNIKCLDIVEEHYLKLLRFALYLEEYQCNEDMKKHEMLNKTIEQQKNDSKDNKQSNSNSNLFHITVDDLDEERPWIRTNDYVDVIDTYNGKVYTLRVNSVTQTDIVANDDSATLRAVHTDGKLYNIKFRFQNYPLRCAHHALSSMPDGNNTVTYLFPTLSKSYFNDNTHDYSDLEIVNPNIAGNAEQKQAILNIVNKSSFPAPYILYGPPGTGKTATLVEALCQIHNRDDCSNVLVCTPSNTAGDEIARRLLEFLPCESIYRMYSQSMNCSKIDEQLETCSNVENKKIVLPTRRDFYEKRITITTLCNAIRLIIMGVDYSHFSHVFIDEAGQGTEPDILIPISLVSAGGNLYSQIVLAGDPQQLGPTVISKYAESILGRSILERLMSYDLYQKDSSNKYNPKYITKLLNNYRSHPAIIHISNRLFYNSELIAKCPKGRGKKDKFPIIFHGIQGKEEKYSYSPSVCNRKEVHSVLGYVEDLLKNRLGFGKVTAKEIGIVTPFTLQSKKIKKALKDRKLNDINVGTVELFQGQERKVMIFTAVRSKMFDYQDKKHIGFLSNFKRFNVAITRAKKLLIVIGNPMVLQIDKNWRFLVKFCIDNDSYRGMRFSWLSNYSDSENVDPSHLVKSTALLEQQSLPLNADDTNLIDLMNTLNIFN